MVDLTPDEAAVLAKLLAKRDTPNVAQVMSPGKSQDSKGKSSLTEEESSKSSASASTEVNQRRERVQQLLASSVINEIDLLSNLVNDDDIIELSSINRMTLKYTLPNSLSVQLFDDISFYKWSTVVEDELRLYSLHRYVVEWSDKQLENYSFVPPNARTILAKTRNWLLDSLSDDLRLQFETYKNPRELWKAIQGKFSFDTLAKKADISAKFLRIVNNTGSMSGQQSAKAVKKMVEQLNIYKHYAASNNFTVETMDYLIDLEVLRFLRTVDVLKPWVVSVESSTIYSQQFHKQLLDKLEVAVHQESAGYDASTSQRPRAVFYNTEEAKMNKQQHQKRKPRHRLRKRGTSEDGQYPPGPKFSLCKVCGKREQHHSVECPTLAEPLSKQRE